MTDTPETTVVTVNGGDPLEIPAEILEQARRTEARLTGYLGRMEGEYGIGEMVLPGDATLEPEECDWGYPEGAHDEDSPDYDSDYAAWWRARQALADAVAEA